MEAKRCEGCGARKSRPGAGEFDMLDYCAKCSRDLCDKCMAEGCCGEKPAKSGTEADHGDALADDTADKDVIEKHGHEYSTTSKR